MLTAWSVASSAAAQKVNSLALTHRPMVWIWTESNAFLRPLDPWWASPNSSSSRGTASQNVRRLPGENTRMRIWRQMGIQRDPNVMSSLKTQISSGVTARSMNVIWSEGSTTLFTSRLWQMPYVKAKGGTDKQPKLGITVTHLAFRSGN